MSSWLEDKRARSLSSHIFLPLVGVRCQWFCIWNLLRYFFEGTVFPVRYRDLACKSVLNQRLLVCYRVLVCFPIRFLCTPFNHKTRWLMLRVICVTIARHTIEADIDLHWQILWVIVFDLEEGVVPFSVEILYRVVDQESSSLCEGVGTRRATIVKMPPVADVSSWSVWILRKKSIDLSIEVHV